MHLSTHIWLLAAVAAVTVVYSLSGRTKVNKKRCVMWATVILTLFSGLRSWQIGDVYHYCYVFLQCNTPGWKLDIHSSDTIGFQLLCRAVGRLNLGFEVCLFLIAAFAAITLGVMVFKYSPSPYLSYLLYICMGNYIFTFYALKQTIAMGFIVLAMMAVIEAKPVRFLVFVGLATLFHTPACIFLIAYVVARKRFDFSYFVILAVIAACVMIFRDQIVRFATELYYEGELQFSADEGVGGKFIMMLAILVISVFVRPLNNREIKYRYMFNIMICAVIIQSFSIYDNIFTRLADYYFQFFVIFVPIVFNEHREVQPAEDGAVRNSGYRLPHNMHMLALAGITAFSVVFYLNNLNNSAALLDSFHFFWEVDVPYSLDLLEK